MAVGVRILVANAMLSRVVGSPLSLVDVVGLLLSSSLDKLPMASARPGPRANQLRPRAGDS